MHGGNIIKYLHFFRKKNKHTQTHTHTHTQRQMKWTLPINKPSHLYSSVILYHFWKKNGSCYYLQLREITKRETDRVVLNEHQNIEPLTTSTIFFGVFFIAGSTRIIKKYEISSYTDRDLTGNPLIFKRPERTITQNKQQWFSWTNILDFSWLWMV